MKSYYSADLAGSDVARENQCKKNMEMLQLAKNNADKLGLPDKIKKDEAYTNFRWNIKGQKANEFRYSKSFEVLWEFVPLLTTNRPTINFRARDPLTRRQRQGVRQVLTAMSEHVATHGNLPSHHDIAVRTQLSEGDVDSLLGMGAASVNLEEEFAEGLRYMDVIADTETLSPAEAADQSLSMEALRCAIRQLPERDQQLLYFRHHEQLGVKEIALAFDVTPGRVSQMYNEIVMRLRVLMKTNA